MTTRLIEYRASEHEILLRAWLCSPHVVEWWGVTSLEEAIDASESASCRIVTEDGVPVGFVRWHRLSRKELDAAGLADIPSGGFDIDLLIGGLAHLGRGIGSRALREAEAFLRASSQPAFLSLCTEVRNERAIRCYRRAGFAIVRSFAESGREYYFLRRETNEAEPSATDNPDDAQPLREDH